MLLKNSMRNAIFAFVFQIVALGLSFLNRIIVTKYLGVDYLGINSVFSNLVYLFSVAECGISFAIIYAMYDSMAKADKNKLLALIQLFQKIYTIIGTVILILGLCLIPFLSFFIGETVNIKHTTLIYIIFLVNSVVPYFAASRKSVVSVAQKEYLLTTATNIIKILQLAIQTLILFLFKDYVIYIAVMLAMTLLTNFIIVIVSYKVFPEQKTRERYYLEAEEKKKLFSNVRALVISNISGIVFSATDSIVISHYMGLTAVAIYSNYYMIYTSLHSILYMSINAITASVGNLGATEEPETVYKKLKNVCYINFFVISLFVSEMLISYQDVMQIAYGSDLLLSKAEMAFMSLNFLLYALRLPVLVFRNALGIFKYDKYKGIFEVVINLGLSIILVRYIGILGVLLGTFISTILVSIWIEPLMLFKHGFKMSIKEYLKFVFPYLIYTTLICGIAYGFNYVNIEASILKIITEWVVLGIFVCLSYFIIFRKKPESMILNKMLEVLKIKLQNKK